MSYHMFHLTWTYSLDTGEDSEMFSWIQVIENNILLWTEAWKKTVSIQNEKWSKELTEISAIILIRFSNFQIFCQ